ncbi:MAG: hypothetical protein AAB779_01325 [Patescibacteria group bacterium]
MLGNWIDPAYLFNRNLGPFTSKIAWVALLGMFLAMFVAWYLKKKAVKNGDIFSKKASRRFFVVVWTMAWIGVVLWFFRQINVAYLSAPILFLVWAIIGLVWLFFVAKYWFKVVPERRGQLSSETLKKQYLPR